MLKYITWDPLLLAAAPAQTFHAMIRIFGMEPVAKLATPPVHHVLDPMRESAPFAKQFIIIMEMAFA